MAGQHWLKSFLERHPELSIRQAEGLSIARAQGLNRDEGVNKRPEFQESLPTGAKVYMNKKSAYVNSELFQKWLKEQFVPIKPQGKVLIFISHYCY
ncbi:unnamed protein product [Leptidea sinapis]|uniref:HTH CENPB-type domain-containing protein n=1 Tax=Leptidea sinapis TaxID=189913 RepID=A0A5E4QXC2_9NEOP|nr:unnamed protein product [Leptidea sinapis]